MALRVLIVGYGRMGKEIEALCDAHDCEVVERLDIHNNTDGVGIDPARLPDVDVAIDFSTADATIVNLPRLAAAGINTVIGTTGWNAEETAIKKVVAETGIGVVVAANFSLGVNLFQAIVEQAARMFAPLDEFGSWIHEAHHAAKIDAPSGTALALQDAMRSSGYEASIDMSSTRVGTTPGTHTVGFDGPFETVTLTHSTRNRATFARGALEAARWVNGKQGWYTMRDVLGLEQ
jgi:4-hydroxy-tetrahydrodipicolinate reductase